MAETLRLEETRFRRTLERGLSILDAETRDLSEGQNLSGETAFTLYDTSSSRRVSEIRLSARTSSG
jgi:alanyl-tRNA synthetase